MDYKHEYAVWKEKATDSALAAELKDISNDENELKERFSVEMAFGTAGIRGKMGAGTSRMNIYTVRRATQGLANHIIGCYGGGSVAISYDTRNNSRLFAEESASVLAACGIKVFIYDDAEPTPMLSFAVRSLDCRMGIMITASHNPAEYNGYKVFGADGCQITENDAKMILSCIERLDYFEDIKTVAFAGNQLISSIGRKLTADFYKAVLETSAGIKPAILSKLKVAYTPLHGTGCKHIIHLLNEIGVKELSVVEEQRDPDGDFTTCEYPNPETEGALRLGVKLCLDTKSDILLATDPDADRVGVAVRTSETECRILTGNEIGVLLLDFIIKQRRENGSLPDKPVAVRSLVSTALTDKIAEKSGVELRRVLTGFKYIGEQIYRLEQSGEQERFIFGFEESCGYLAGDYVRDKDANGACVLISEMAAVYKKEGKTLCDVLAELYSEYGYFKTKTLSFEFEGLAGAKKMADKMDFLRKNQPEQIDGRRVNAISDYRTRQRLSTAMKIVAPIDLPTADIVEWELMGDATVIIRPSGTEPKIKVYLMVCEKTEVESNGAMARLAAKMTEIINA